MTTTTTKIIIIMLIECSGINKIRKGAMVKVLKALVAHNKWQQLI